MEEKTTSYKKNDNGSYSKTGIITQKPEDGFVEHHGAGGIEYRKGRGKWLTYETDNPKLTRPFVYIFCAAFMGVMSWIFYEMTASMPISRRKFLMVIYVGIISFCAYCMFGMLRDINKREEQQQRETQEQKRRSKQDDN